MMGHSNFISIVLLLTLTGCGTSGGVSSSGAETADVTPTKNAARSGAEYAQTYIDFKHGDTASAEARLKSLLTTADGVTGEPYIRAGLFNRRAEYASGLAWAALERGEVQGARRQFSDAVRKLAEDEQELVRVTRQDDESKQMAGTAISLGLIGLAAGLDYKNVQAGTYQANTSVLTTLQNSGAVKYLSQPVDTTDQLNLFLGEQPRDTDGVRMIIMPALNGPLSLVGRIKVQKSDTMYGSCTGALVGPRTVLTAAHCFTDGYRKAIPSEVTFTIASPTYENTARVRDIITPTEIWRDGDFENDWAVVILDHNPSASQDSLIADDSFNPAQKGTRWSEKHRSNLFLPGYSSDLDDGRFLTLAAKCSFEKVLTNKQAMHRCPSWKGASGAPVIVKHGTAGLEAYHVVGIHVWSRGDKFDPQVVRGMRLINAEVAEAIRRANLN